MREASARQLVPAHALLRRASEERARLGARIRRLDAVACAHAAWRRALSEDAAAATAAVATAGLALDQADSVWRDATQPAVAKLVAVGAGAGWKPRVVRAATEADFRAKFGARGTSGALGSARIARAARAEMAALVERLLALVVLEFKLRASGVARAPVPLELQPGALAVGDDDDDDAPGAQPPAHVAAYAAALKAQRGRARHDAAFASAVARAVARAIRGAFFGCLALVSSTRTAVVDAPMRDAPRVRAALQLINRVLSTAARCRGLLAHDCDDEEAVPLVRYDRDAQTFSMPDLENAVAAHWPEARALADAAAACEAWVRDARRPVPPPPLEGEAEDAAWWVGLGARGLAVDDAAKAATFARLDAAAAAAAAATTTAWWEAWPPSRDAVLEREACLAAAIAWGGKATAAFLGIAQPDQYVGRAPFG